MKNIKIISFISAILVLIIAVFAFILSFDAIRNLAMAHSIPSSIAFMVPFIIDGLMVVLSVGVLRSALLGEMTAVNWIFIIAFTAVSIGFNVVHSDQTWTGISFAILYPVSLLIAFESFMAQIKSSVKRGQIVDSQSALITRVESLKSEYESLKNEIAESKEILKNAEHETEKMKTVMRKKAEAEIVELTNEKTRLVEQISELNRTAHASDLSDPKRLMLAYLRNNPAATFAEIGGIIGRAPSTVSRYANEMETAGIVHKNGNGWEVK